MGISFCWAIHTFNFSLVFRESYKNTTWKHDDRLTGPQPKTILHRGKNTKRGAIQQTHLARIQAQNQKISEFSSLRQRAAFSKWSEIFAVKPDVRCATYQFKMKWKRKRDPKPAIEEDHLRQLKASVFFSLSSPLSLLRNVGFHIILFFCQGGCEGQRALTTKKLQLRCWCTGRKFTTIAHDEASKNHWGGVNDKRSDKKEARIYETEDQNNRYKALKLYLKKVEQRLWSSTLKRQSKGHLALTPLKTWWKKSAKEPAFPKYTQTTTSERWPQHCSPIPVFLIDLSCPFQAIETNRPLHITTLEHLFHRFKIAVMCSQ